MQMVRQDDESQNVEGMGCFDLAQAGAQQIHLAHQEIVFAVCKGDRKEFGLNNRIILSWQVSVPGLSRKAPTGSLR
jgi:hypothetical protein